MDAFVYTVLPGRVVFDRGTLARVADEVRRLGGGRTLVLSAPEQVGKGQTRANRLDDLAAGVLAEAAMHTPTAVTERGRSRRTISALNA